MVVIVTGESIEPVPVWGLKIVTYRSSPGGRVIGGLPALLVSLSGTGVSMMTVPGWPPEGDTVVIVIGTEICGSPV
jgi:hypothetical protein